ncbi:hypothetical protein FACS1894208_05450 [Clostridia bacterium]|nr:hypothetical protein FACS1894208_05450 [Clostridia bacterium]
MKTTVINIKAEHFRRDSDVYIGRGSKWGNPFVIGHSGTRDDVCDKYEAYMSRRILENPQKYNISELRGKRLVCYCKPLRCHGDWLATLANEEVMDDGRV